MEDGGAWRSDFLAATERARGIVPLSGRALCTAGEADEGKRQDRGPPSDVTMGDSCNLWLSPCRVDDSKITATVASHPVVAAAAHRLFQAAVLLPA